jgi:hypothetical protein
MRDQNIDVDQYVPDCYRKDSYAACYSHMIYPTNGQNLWTKTEFVDLQPPPIKRQPGRPKKKRNREAGEMKKDNSQLKRARNGIRCGRCQEIGHN